MSDDEYEYGDYSDDELYDSGGYGCGLDSGGCGGSGYDSDGCGGNFDYGGEGDAPSMSDDEYEYGGYSDDEGYDSGGYGCGYDSDGRGGSGFDYDGCGGNFDCGGEGDARDCRGKANNGGSAYGGDGDGGGGKQVVESQLKPSSYGGYYNPTAVVPKQGQSSGSYQTTYKNTNTDKITGSYTRATVKESTSTGDVFKERGSGRVGHKDEHKTTFTYRIGDESGFSEYQLEERCRRVSFPGASSTSSSKSGFSLPSNQKYLK